MAVESAGLILEIREDRHFFTTVRDFAAHVSGRKSLRLEFFYRELRQRHDILMDDDKPAGGQWNFDADNREAFGPQGPGPIPARATFKPDVITQEVITLVDTRFARLRALPGQLREVKLYKRCNDLLTSVCLYLVAMRMLYGLASPGFITRSCPQP
jgi:deoxyribodipyrimidine photolyase-like uncharacterized protein